VQHSAAIAAGTFMAGGPTAVALIEFGGAAKQWGSLLRQDLHMPRACQCQAILQLADEQARLLSNRKIRWWVWTRTFKLANVRHGSFHPNLMLSEMEHAPIYADMFVNCSRVVVLVVGATSAYTSKLQLLQADSADANEH